MPPYQPPPYRPPAVAPPYNPALGRPFRFTERPRSAYREGPGCGQMLIALIIFVILATVCASGFGHLPSP